MTSTNDGNEVNSNQRSNHRNKYYYIELYKSLEARLNGEESLEARTSHVCEVWRRVYSLYQHSAPSTHPHLFSWLQRHTAHTVLQSKWAKSKNEHARLTAAIDSLVGEVQAAAAGRDPQPWEQLLLQRAAWFRKALENPWGHPVLKSLIDPDGEPVTDQQVLEWVVEERGIVLVTRLRQLVSAGNCDDLALLLASAVMDRARAATPRRPDDAADEKVEVPVDNSSFVAILERDASFTVDVWELLTDIELVLLLKTDKRPRCIELAKLTPLRHGYAMVERLRNRLDTSPRDKKLWKHAKEVATLVTQVIIARCMVLSKCGGVGRAALYCCARSLARLLPAARLPAVSNTLAAAAATARHLHTFCTALDAECSADMKPFICELYIRAITAGMNEHEQLKLNAEKAMEARSCEQMLASWFSQLGALLEGSVRLRAECALTAFSVHPARKFYEPVAKMPPPQPPQPPPNKTAQEPAPETTSEFGSWASDSRTQSNLVKTSETLQLKQTEQHQANVLSTAVLTEGETLGLEPELCQDLAVLLSGPRVKTLSWDMDREVLLQNCKSYMERTHGGTRAVTTELKYLNLDPSAYRHLPEEDDEETGIERGYEHELLVENPEEIWQDAFFDAEVTETADDSEVEIQISKKKTKAPVVSSDDEEDPLSCIADAKKEKKKLAKEESKERRRKKTHKRDNSKDGSKDQRKDKTKKTKKESKKNKSEQPTTGSLTSLLGMKVSKMPSLVQDGEKRVRKKKERRRDTMFSYVSVTDSDYDSQEKLSQKSDNESNIVVDGVFSMDELKSPDRQSSDSQITLDNMKPTSKSYGIAQSTVINDIKSRPKVSSPKVSTTSEDSDVSRSKSPYLTPNQLTNRHVISSKVKSSIRSKLLQYRRNKSVPRPVSRSPAPRSTPTIPTQTLVGMKIYKPDEITKDNTNKKQPQEAVSKDVSNSLNMVKETSNTVINRPQVPYNETVKTDTKFQNLYNVQKHSEDYNTVMHIIPKNAFNENPKVHNEYVQSSPTKVVQHGIYMTNQSPTNIHTNYVSPVKTADHMSSQALNVTPPKPTAHQTFHKSMQNLSTDNMKYDLPKRPVLFNDFSYYQHSKSNSSQLSPKIISNNCIKPPNQSASSSQQYPKDDFTKQSHDSVISRGYVQYVNSQLTNPKSEVIRYGSKQLSSSMQDVNPKKHIPNAARLGHTSHLLPHTMKSHSELSNIAHTLRTSNSASSSRSTCSRNRERIDVKNQQNVLSASHNPVVGVKTNYKEFFDNLSKTINAGSSSPERNFSIALNKDVKVTPVQVPSTSVTAKRIDSSPQSAKQLIQQKKPDNAPNTFSRRSYMHKNKQSENKVVCDTLELNKNIMEHKLAKAKSMKNDLVISRVSMNDSNTQNQGNTGNVNQSSTKLQKACPLLTSMLDSPGKYIGKCQSSSNVSNIATSQKPSENQTDREHADLLLLLRQQPVVKPNPNTPVALTSGITSSNTQTKAVTQVPLAHKSLIGAKVKHNNTVLGNTLSMQKESTPQNNAPQDWERVMDALLAHKTEPLGPNALDMVLKKDYKGHAQSSSREHANHKPRTSGQSSSKSKSDSRKREQHSSKPSSSRKPSTEKHSEIPKRHRQSEIIKKASSTEMLKRAEVQNKYVGSNSSKDDDPFISGIPNSAYDMLGDLMDDDLRQELGELSSDEDAYITPKVTVTKGKSGNIPKTATSACKVSNVAKENPHIVDPKVIVCKNETNPNTVDANRRTYSTIGYPSVITNNSSRPNDTTLQESSSTVVSSNVEQQHTTTVITSQIVQSNANLGNHAIIGPNHFVNNFEPTNVIITSVPVPAQPVVIIRQDLVYDPYPTIRIHESQVSAGLCSVNQNVYALNSTPNIAVYQTTQFAAPVVNPVIIGNAMTSTNVSDAVAMGDQQRTSDSINEDVNPKKQEVQDSIDPPNPNRFSEDIEKKTEKPISLDFNMNKNCERKVLSQMQENYFSENVDTDSHLRRLSIDDYSSKTKQDEERIKLKRQSLLNREISHACYHPPIPLTYTPLSKKMHLGKLLQQETPKNGTVKPNLMLVPDITNGVEKRESTDSSIVKIPKLEINNENIESTDLVSSAKENQKSCRRIWLRSSNKLVNKKDSPVKRTRIPLRRNKFKLKVTKKGIVKLTGIETEINVKNVTRVSSRILNKKQLNKSVTGISSPVQQKQNVEINELIDFEQELSSSTILKTSTAVIEAEERLEQAIDINNLTDHKQLAIGSSDTIAERQNNLDDIKETEVAPESDRSTNDDLKPTVVIERIKHKLGSQLVINSDITVKNENLTILSDKSLAKDKPADMTTVHPKDSIDMTKCIKVSPAVQKKTQKTDETSNINKTTAAEKLSHKMLTKAANTIVQRKSNRHTKTQNAEVSTQSNAKQINKTDSIATLSKTAGNHTQMTQKSIANDCSIVIDQPQAQPFPEAKDMQLSNIGLGKSNSSSLITNRKQQIETNINRLILCHEKVNDVRNNSSVSNSNAISEKIDDIQKSVSQPSYLNQQTNTRPPMLNEKTSEKKNARQSQPATDKNKERQVYTKEGIKIEVLPNCKDTGVTHIRISLPNGTGFKATISGSIHDQLDSLFEHPVMKSLLRGGLSKGKRYILNYTQVSKADTANPRKIIATQIQNMEIKDTTHIQKLKIENTTPIDTVNLVSDDEDEVETRTFTTEFGNYTTNVDQEAFNKHQKKFTQKCEVKLIKNNHLEINETKLEVKSLPPQKISQLTRNMSKMATDAMTTPNISPEVDFNVKYDDDVLTSVTVNSTNKPTYTQEMTTLSRPFPMVKRTLLTRNQSKVASSISATMISPELDSKIKDFPVVSGDSTDKLTTGQETTLGLTDPIVKNTLVTGNQIKLVTNATFIANMLSDCESDIKEGSPPAKVESTHKSILAQDTTTQNKLEANATPIAIIIPEGDCINTKEDSPPAKVNSTHKSSPAQQTTTPQKSCPVVISTLLPRNQNNLETNVVDVTSSMISELDPNSENNNDDLPPVYVDSTKKPKFGHGTSTPLRSLPTVMNPSILTRDQNQLESEAATATKTIPEVGSYTKDDRGDLLSVNVNYTDKSTNAQRTSAPLRSISPVMSSLPTINQNKLDSDATATAKIRENDSNTIYINNDLPPVHVKSTNELTPTRKLSTSLEQANEVHTSEIIEIDDSSNDSVENLTSKTDSNRIVEPNKEIIALRQVLSQDFGVIPANITDKKQKKAVNNFKTALLQDLGFVPVETPVIDMTNDEDDMEKPIVIQKKSIVKECVVRLLKCDNLIKRYELMQTMKRCYVKLELLNKSIFTTTSVVLSEDETNNKITDERKQDNDEDLIEFDVEETSGSPQLSRCPSLSILNNWNDEYQHPLVIPYRSSPVMEIYDTISQLRNELTEKAKLVNKSENLFAVTCDSEWMVTKFGYRNQEMIHSSLTPTTGNKGNYISLTDCKSIIFSDDEKLLTTSKAPSLLTITLKFLDHNPDLVYQMESMRKIRKISIITPSNKLKRKTEILLEDTVANKFFKLGTLALNALNTCFKGVAANDIPHDQEDNANFSTENSDITATMKEIKDLKLMAGFVPLSDIEINKPDTRQVVLKVPVTNDQNTNTLSTDKDYNISEENIEDVKEVDEMEDMESHKPTIVKIDLKPSITETQASCSKDITMTNTYVEKIEDAEKIVDSGTLLDFENNTLENNDTAQKTPAANTISGIGDCYTATTLEKIEDKQIEMNVRKEQYLNDDKSLSSTSNVKFKNEHHNTHSEDPSILLYDTDNSEIDPTLKTEPNDTSFKTEHQNDPNEGATHYDEKVPNIVDIERSEITDRTFGVTEVKREETSTFKDKNIDENINETKTNNESSIDVERNITCNNAEIKNNIEIERFDVARSLTPEDIVQSNNNKLEGNIDPEAPLITKSDSEGVEPSEHVGINTQRKQHEYQSKINTSQELDNKNENKLEENHTDSSLVSTIQAVNEETPVKMNDSSQQAAESSNVANISNNFRLDEIPVEDLCFEVYEVEVVDSHEEDVINIVETLCVRSPESISVNASILKSPIFVDNREILFNYHDYTKLPERRENTGNHSYEDNKQNSDNFNEESSSKTNVKATGSCINVALKEDPLCEDTSVHQKISNNINIKSRPDCKYELIQEDDWLTVITTENDKDDSEISSVLVSPCDLLEDTIVASVRSKNTSFNMKGFEYDDVYVFPLTESRSNSNTSNESLSQELNGDIKVISDVVKNDLYDIDCGVIKPHVTYSRKCIKRKISMRDVKVPEKKYRKGKNIDCSKQTETSMTALAYSKEYKRRLEYCTSVKFSYSRPFHIEYAEVEDLVSKWPITDALGDVLDDVPDVAHEHLFANLEELDVFQPDPATQTLAEEIRYEYETDAAQETSSSEADETNFNMGFGEGSGRVIQILKKEGESNISAATLSDVKQSQPVFKSVDLDDCNNHDTNKDDLLMKIRKHFNFIELRDKVRSFFKKSSVELKSDWMLQNIKDNADLKWKYSDRYRSEEFPFDLYSLEYMKPLRTETIVQVVQLGQLPVSAAAQNPVTCDPRVTQVSDASPSQCSVHNSPNDDSQSDIKTEYTELTTADLTLPLQEYAQQNQAMNLASHESNVEIIEQTISLEMEIKAEDTPEIKEEIPDINEEKSNSSEADLHTLTNATPENLDHSFNNNADKSDVNNVIYESSDQTDSVTFSQQRQQNGTSEKTDQIAHAMNAAGITTTPETVTNTRAHALVNILSQKMRHGSVSTTQTTTNTYSKTTSINAMALQQALAQILPPPLNQTGSSESNQTQSPVGPQVLHIVQGKNASGNQITLVDNSQQSVISTPNATQVLHIVQNKGATAGQASNGTLTPQANSFSGLSLVDAGLHQSGNQLLHIVNTGNQKTASPGQLLKRVNLLTNLTNVQGSNEQKMVQFVCKSADGKAIQLNAPHQRSMVLRLQPIETPPAKTAESQEPSQSPTGSTSSKDSASQQEIKSRSIYEENYAKFIQNSSSKTPGLEKSTSLPKFNQAFGKPVFQEGSQKQGEAGSNNSHLPPVNTNRENAECPPTDNAINLEHIAQIGSPPLLIRKPAVTSQSQSNIVQQIKQTIAPMNIQTMHGGVIYTRQIPVNIGGGQTINLITVPSTELINDDTPKTQTQTSQGEIEPSIIKIVPQSQSTTNTETSQEESNNHAGSSNDSAPTPQPQPVLTQMRIKLPMLSKAPQMVPGARVVRPSFFQIQRNVIGGANQPVYQQLVLTAAPPLGQQTIRLPQNQASSRPIKVQSEGQSSSSESQMSSSTLEQLREFDMVLEQVKERSTVQPTSNSNSNSFKIHTSSSDTTDGNGSSNCSTESTPQVLYSIGNNQSLNVAYVNRKTTITTPTTSTYVRSPDSSGIADSPTSSTHVQIPHTVTTASSPTEMSSQSKPAKVGSKTKSRPKSTSNPPNTLKLNSVPPKTSSQKPLEDEQTTQRILYILAEYKEQVENSPDKDKPAPRRRSNPPSNPGSSKRKKSSSSRRSGTRDMSPVHGEDTCRTMGSEDSSCGTSQGDCNESCLDSHSPQDSPRKVARKITFDQDLTVTQPRPQPQRNVIVADGQTITVARGTTGKPATAVLMPANYILPVSMVKGGQQIAIVTNRGPKLLTVGGEGGATNALLLQRLIGPAGLKPVLARPGVRHVRLPTAALHNLQAFNLATATSVQPPDSTASPTSGPTPPELVDTRATSSPWTDRDSHDVKPERASSPEGSEPWNLPSSADAHEYTYEETVRTDNMDRTVLVVQKKDGSQRQHRLSHVSAAALRHKYAILEHELRLQKSLSEECEDLGVDSPSASELFPEAELLFAASPAHEHNQDPHHSHTPQPTQSSIPQPDMDDQIATDHLIPREIDVGLGLGDVGIVAVSEDGMQATIALDQEEFARSHPNTTFHSEPTEEEVQPFTITGLKGRHITSTIFHSNSAPATVLMAAPQTTVISQAPDHGVKYEIENMINAMPSSHNNDMNLSSVLVKDDGLTRFDNILTDSRELHLTNTASAIVHSSGNATQVIRRVCYEDDKRERDARFLIDEPDNLIAGDDAKMVAEDNSRDATLESMADVDDDRSSPERHAELFWESNSASERSEGRRPLDFSSDSDKCCKSPSFDETNSTDSSGVGTHMRLDSVIKEARGRERSGSADGSSADDTHPPLLRTYPPKRMYHPLEGEAERSLSGKTRAGERSPDSLEVRRRASGRGVVKRGCHCCNGSPAPPRPKKPRQRKPTLDFNTNT